VSQKLKSEGNEAFQNQKFDKSQEKYEEALGIFRYIESISFENMKDEDLVYHQFDESSLDPPLKNVHQKHLIALYLNISSCLAKKNKKEEAIFSAEEALKIEDTAKGHYKRAIAYL
jgi:tetratricopeptide (TPR) repeat protein